MQNTLEKGNNMSFPRLTPRSSAPCLGVSPTLHDICAHGWHDLALLLLQAEERERDWMEKEERLCRYGVICAAHERAFFKKTNMKELNFDEEDGQLADRLPKNVPDLKLSRTTLDQWCTDSAASSSPSSVRSNACGTSNASAAPSLTPYQRFCLTKSTAAHYQWTSKTRHTSRLKLNSPISFVTSQPVKRPASYALPPPPPRKRDYVEENIRASATPSPRAGPTTFAATASPQRDLWSWPHARSRDMSAPETVPTLSRTYGDAKRRAAWMELIFDRLSYRAKALVARQAESLGFLPATTPAVSSSRRDSKEQSLSSQSQRQQHDSRSHTSSEALQDAAAAEVTTTDVDAMVLDCVSEERPTVTNCNSE